MKDNYLELKVPLRQDAEWFVKLREAMAAAHIPVKWQSKGSYHITVAFINGDEQVGELSAAFNKCIDERLAPSLTLDKLDAFVAKNGDEIILNLTSSHPSLEFIDFVTLVRQAASNLNAEIDSDFKLHVTLGRIAADATHLEDVKKVLASIQVPPFSLSLVDAEYRYYRGETIRKWEMNKAQPTKKNSSGIGGLDYRKINREVMTDTKQQYESVEELKEAVKYSIEHQYMVAQEERIDMPASKNSQTRYVCSGKRSFEAAKAYRGKKTAVLNYANNHAIGGAPFSAGAQEESLCRCSTLLPCLEAMREPFYQRHIRQFEAREIGYMGNDDLIYTPEVVVFKSDERTDPVYPKMMNRSEWYKVDIITCAAPEMKRMQSRPANYEAVITQRIKKILDVAAKEKVEVLILGAWGCGDFRNPIDVVAKVFLSLLKNYNFEVVEFALASKGDVSNSPFAQADFASLSI